MLPTTVIGTRIHGEHPDFVTFRSPSYNFVEAAQQLQEATGVLFDVFTFVIITDGDEGEQIHTYWSGTSDQLFRLDKRR